ncbi:DUF1523 family protein [Paracoccus liaowanqingii]|uniref:DUF1523 family protein n=1 Tax=Paracoccus liaowanqingii TaxID=2560053 RepID=A0A4P7HIA4_9RHOB|nr:DUF1523 family protein [Paracoccus liaowanqingii]QBX33799.1 DUF1523 family protein [Paracoccus liaowanqingii]
MYYLRVVIGVLFGVLIFALLDYTLPSKNTVRISNTYNRLTAIPPSATIFWASDSTGTVENAQGQRDVRFIDAVRPGGSVFVYRNEDTGWVWPPYFKYDSANLQAEATNLQSGTASPIWVSVTAYGWRLPWMSTYPNAVSINTVAGPDDRPLNWAAMVICAVLLALLTLVWRMWGQFRQRGMPRRGGRA